MATCSRSASTSERLGTPCPGSYAVTTCWQRRRSRLPARSRRRGLLGRDHVDGVLVLRPCRQVHTFGMQFPIDVAFCDRYGFVLHVSGSNPAGSRASSSARTSRSRRPRARSTAGRSTSATSSSEGCEELVVRDRAPGLLPELEQRERPVLGDAPAAFLYQLFTVDAPHAMRRVLRVDALVVGVVHVGLGSRWRAGARSSSRRTHSTT